jgi:hypothetical protein
MRKSVFGLVVAGATLAGVIGSAYPAFAVNISDKLIQDYSYTTPVLDSDFSLDGTSALIQSSNSTAAPAVAFAAPILYWCVALGVYLLSTQTCQAPGPETPPQDVPWETDALPVIGSTILFAGGLWAKNKFAKPLEK